MVKNLIKNLIKTEKKIVDKDCIYYKVGGTCNKCELKAYCNSYLENIKNFTN